MRSGWGRVWLLAWAAASCVWMAAMAFLALETQPQIPLDMSRGDPQVVAAYDRATMRHMVGYLFVAVGPPALLFLVLWLVVGLRRPASPPMDGRPPGQGS
jgi:hypothetical protein